MAWIRVNKCREEALNAKLSKALTLWLEGSVEIFNVLSKGSSMIRIRSGKINLVAEFMINCR